MRLHAAAALNTQRQPRKVPHLPPSLAYQVIRVIGQGAFGVVYLAKTRNNKRVAIKKTRLDPRYKNREIEILSQLKHPNCVRLIDTYKTKIELKDEIYINIVMDYSPFNLQSYLAKLHNDHGYLPNQLAKLYIYQLLSGVDYLHSLGITHRDLKPQNILIDPKAKTLKICDFGSAKQLHPNEKSVAYIASRHYRAPELILGCCFYSEAVDIWAVGCIVFELLTAGKVLFNSTTTEKQLTSIARIIGVPTREDLESFYHTEEPRIDPVERVTLRKLLPKHIGQEFIDFLETIFVYDPEKRPTAKELMEKPLFEEIKGLIEEGQKALPQIEFVRSCL